MDRAVAEIAGDLFQDLRLEMLQLGGERPIDPQTQRAVAGESLRNCVLRQILADNGRPIIHHARRSKAALAVYLLRYLMQGGSERARMLFHET